MAAPVPVPVLEPNYNLTKAESVNSSRAPSRGVDDDDAMAVEEMVGGGSFLNCLSSATPADLVELHQTLVILIHCDSSANLPFPDHHHPFQHPQEEPVEQG
jgi:hypothetical protein